MSIRDNIGNPITIIFLPVIFASVVWILIREAWDAGDYWYDLIADWASGATFMKDQRTIRRTVNSINDQLREHGVDMQFDPEAFTKR